MKVINIRIQSFGYHPGLFRCIQYTFQFGRCVYWHIDDFYTWIIRFGVFRVDYDQLYIVPSHCQSLAFFMVYANVLGNVNSGDVADLIHYILSIINLLASVLLDREAQNLRCIAKH